MSKQTASKNGLKDGFSLVELIIVIAIMAILIGVIALAVIPNIQRSKESKDLAQLDSIASAANTAIAANKAEGEGIIILGTTGTGIQDVSGFDSIADPTEHQKLKHAIYETLVTGAGKAESTAVGTNKNIVLAYDVPDKKITVAYTASVTADSDTYSSISAVQCEYLDQDYFISNLT